jgi:hypothetical protein
MSVVEESDALHSRVRAFASGAGGDDFERLALDIAQFQGRWSAGYARLQEAHGQTMPAVPVEAFRLTRVAVHPPELDALTFRTSGTTGAMTGVHALRTTETYRELSLLQGPQFLCGSWTAPRVAVALAPAPGSRPSSSLGFMMRLFIAALDGRALCVEPEGSPFDVDAPERWLVGSEGPNLAGLTRAARIASERGESLLVLATSLALLALLEALDGQMLRLPPGSVVMHTGGFKGRRREVAPDALRAAVAEALAIPESHLVGEYGMTELTSQLYEDTLRGSRAGIFYEPRWMRVIPVDPATLEPVGEGERGIARIVDLGNVDSAVAVLTQDVVSRSEGGIALHGRRQGAPERGCSLAIESLVWPT